MMVSRTACFLSAILMAAIMAVPACADVDPEALSLSRSILDATHASAVGDQMLAQMTKAFTAGLNQANPGKEKEVEALLNEVLIPQFQQSMPTLIDQSARVYASNFSVPELKQILAFYQTDIGRKIIEKQPAIIREQSLLAQNFAAALMPEIRNKMLRAIEDRGLKKPYGI